MKIINFFALMMVAVVVAFIGFWVENIWLAFSKGFMDNRNMYLPFLFGYGLAIIVVYILFGVPHRPMFFGIKINFKKAIIGYVYYYGIMILCISIGEIALGVLVEKICGFRWWDYSWIPLHITTYTSLPTSMGFSAIVFFFMRYCFDLLMQFFLEFPKRILLCMGIFFGSILIADMSYNLYLMYKNRKGIVRWHISFKKTD